MVVSIVQSNYIPWKGYFDLINYSDLFIIYDHVQYTKNDWRNRNILMTKQGKKWLTIPVRRRTLEQTIDESEIAMLNWRLKHLKTFASVYGKARYFDQIYTEIENIYDQIESNRLSVINETIIRGICGLLGIETKIKRSTDFIIEGGKNRSLVSLCLQAGATTYLSGPSAKSYLDISSFKQAGVSVRWMDYTGYPVYRQLSEAFDHYVSIVDLFFNMGEETPLYMKSFLET